MNTLKNVALTVLTLIPLAELLFLPFYLSNRASADLNSFTGTYMICTLGEGGCSVPVEPPE